ncbi:basic helix-loop-helix leucine zipper transcription factor [Tanacetum coccineum]
MWSKTFVQEADLRGLTAPSPTTATILTSSLSSSVEHDNKFDDDESSLSKTEEEETEDKSGHLVAWSAFELRSIFTVCLRSSYVEAWPLASDGFIRLVQYFLVEKGVVVGKLKASLMWTINDFPAYANLSGRSTKGRVACPVCVNFTHSRWLKHGKKFCYMGHRRWLEPNHSCRFQKERFDGTVENRGPPTPLTGSDVLKQLSGIRLKYGKSKKRTREEDVGSTSTHAKEATHEDERSKKLAFNHIL